MVWLKNRYGGWFEIPDDDYKPDYKSTQIKENEKQRKDVEETKWTQEREKECHALARELIDKAHKEETKVTRDLQNAVKVGTGKLSGLQYKFKGEGSLSEKLDRKAVEKDISPKDYAKRVTDVLRYTNESNAANLANDFHIVKANLERRGYKMIECTNTFKEGEVYKGINTLVKTPTGYTFELQFHTKQSLEIKEVNHKLYEEARQTSTSKERAHQLNLEMARNAGHVVHPMDIDTVKDIK